MIRGEKASSIASGFSVSVVPIFMEVCALECWGCTQMKLLSYWRRKRNDKILLSGSLKKRGHYTLHYKYCGQLPISYTLAQRS